LAKVINKFASANGNRLKIEGSKYANK